MSGAKHFRTRTTNSASSVALSRKLAPRVECDARTKLMPYVTHVFAERDLNLEEGVLEVSEEKLNRQRATGNGLFWWNKLKLCYSAPYGCRLANSLPYLVGVCIFDRCMERFANDSMREHLNSVRTAPSGHWA